MASEAWCICNRCVQKVSEGQTDPALSSSQAAALLVSTRLRRWVSPGMHPALHAQPLLGLCAGGLAVKGTAALLQQGEQHQPKITGGNRYLMAAFDGQAEDDGLGSQRFVEDQSQHPKQGCQGNA